MLLLSHRGQGRSSEVSNRPSTHSHGQGQTRAVLPLATSWESRAAFSADQLSEEPQHVGRFKCSLTLPAPADYRHLNQCISHAPALRARAGRHGPGHPSTHRHQTGHACQAAPKLASHTRRLGWPWHRELSRTGPRSHLPSPCPWSSAHTHSSHLCSHPSGP